MSALWFIAFSLIWTGLLAGGAHYLSREPVPARFAHTIWRGAAILSLLQGCESCLLHEDVQGYQEVLGGPEGAVDVQVSFQLFCGLPQRAEGVLQPEGDGGGHGGLHSGNFIADAFLRQVVFVNSPVIAARQRERKYCARCRACASVT